MSDPFQDAHRANARTAEKKVEHQKAIEETVARNARMAARGAKQKFDKPYIWSGPFYK